MQVGVAVSRQPAKKKLRLLGSKRFAVNSQLDHFQEKTAPVSTEI